MSQTSDQTAEPTPESGDREPLERAQRAIDEAHEAASEALRDPAPGGGTSSPDPLPESASDGHYQT